MTHTEFLPFHNRHIQFEYLEDTNFYETYQGVVIDIIPYDQKAVPTEYVFIRTNNMIAWQEAFSRNDQAAQLQLQHNIDISRIHNARLVNPMQ